MHDFNGYFTYIKGCKLQDGYHTVTPVYVDICPPIISVEKKWSQRKKAAWEFQFFIFIIYIDVNVNHLSVKLISSIKIIIIIIIIIIKQTHLVESSDSDIK